MRRERRQKLDTETDNVAALSASLLELGCIMLPMVGSGFSSGVPDRLVCTGRHNTLVEFKNPATPIRLKQVLVARDLNALSFYNSGKLSALAFRFPNELGILQDEETIKVLATVNALAEPQAFVAMVDKLTCYYDHCLAVVRRELGLAEIRKILEQLCIPLQEPRLWHLNTGNRFGYSPLLSVEA